MSISGLRYIGFASGKNQCKTTKQHPKIAFTLAEVLITLGIIGIVAAMTIPTLTKTFEQKALDNQFKKTYALLNQGLLTAQGKYDYMPNCYYKVNANGIALSSSVSECRNFNDTLVNSYKIAKTCMNKAYEQGCIPEYEGIDTIADKNCTNCDVPDGYESYGSYISRGCTSFRKNEILTLQSAYVLQDGTILMPYSMGMPIWLVDINGAKGPNKWGYDIFTFLIGFNDKAFKFYPGGCFVSEQGGASATTMINRLFR